MTGYKGAMFVDCLDKDILYLLSTSLFQKILNNNAIKIEQLNTITALLIKLNIEFSLSVSQGTRSSEQSATLTIPINPTTNIEFAINLEDGVCFF